MTNQTIAFVPTYTDPAWGRLVSPGWSVSANFWVKP